jgi:23S rRNA (guanosine2251-2'-O)-methyltransferase
MILKKGVKVKSDSSSYFICGKNPSFLCLKGKKREVCKIYTSDVEGMKDFLEKNSIKIKPEKIEFRTNTELNSFLKDKNVQHQGIVLEVKNRARMNFDVFLQLCKKNRQPLPKLLVLDEITDPHNVGAIMRTAAAFGVNYIITTFRHGVGDTPTIAKTSAGYSEMVELIEVANLNNAIKELKKVGYFVLGLDGNAKDDVKKLMDVKNMCLALGNEGRGLRSLVKKNCDFLCKIKTETSVESLNVSVACAVAIYQLWS